MKKIKTHTLVGGVLIGVLLVLALLAALWTPYNPLEIGRASCRERVSTDV